MVSAGETQLTMKSVGVGVDNKVSDEDVENYVVSTAKTQSGEKSADEVVMHVKSVYNQGTVNNGACRGREI